VTRQERIAFLLEHLADVPGDRGAGDEHPDVQGWNHTSYEGLEWLLDLLRVSLPRGCRAVVCMYRYARFVGRAFVPALPRQSAPSLAPQS